MLFVSKGSESLNVIDEEQLNKAFSLLNSQLMLKDSEPVELVVCGGSALIATKFVSRTTKDVDIVALVKDMILVDPDPLSNEIIEAAQTVAGVLNLPSDWLNTGPADIYRMGLPEGCVDRLITHSIGGHLTIHFIGRLDQIHFKLYASIDRGGYHIEDLIALNPTDDELVIAANWTKTHDVSEQFAMLIKDFLNYMGFVDAASRL